MYDPRSRTLLGLGISIFLMLVSPCWSPKTEGTAQYPFWEKYTNFLESLVTFSIKFYYYDDEDDDREFRKVHGISLDVLDCL